jgi:hypothetical protein
VAVNAGITKNGKLMFHKTFFMQNKKPYAGLASIRLSSPLVGGNQVEEQGISTISPTENSVAAVSLPALNGEVYSREGSTNFFKRQTCCLKICLPLLLLLSALPVWRHVSI